jgi:hypothetical protein
MNDKRHEMNTDHLLISSFAIRTSGFIRRLLIAHRHGHLRRLVDANNNRVNSLAELQVREKNCS